MSMRFLTLWLTLAGSLILSTVTAAITPIWSTPVAVPGERVILYLVDTLEGHDQFLIRNLPNASNASIRPLEPKAGTNPLDPNQSTVEVYPLLITPDRAGEVTITQLEAEYQSGKKLNIDVPPLPVLPTSQITWYESPVPYGVLWYLNPQEGYVHQPLQAHAKIFLPGDCAAPFPPRLQSVTVKASDFRAPLQGLVAMLQEQMLPNPTAYARKQNWRTADYSGELTPYREGNSTVAGTFSIVQQRGFFNTAQQEVPLPSLTIGALPLPPGAPANFADTVGQYTISVRTDATSLAMNEAVDVEITVRGTGNLQQLETPKPEDEDNWKLIPATRKPLLDASGNTIGMVFNQLMRPVAEVGGIPSFSFSYFDPSTQEYRQAATAPIPLAWKETDTAGALRHNTTATEPPPAGSVPVEEMTDIYSYLPEDTSWHYLSLPRWLWCLLYLPALLILGRMGLQRLLHRLSKGAAGRQQEKELNRLAASDNGVEFLKGIGSFIESHIPQHEQSPELQRILERRDLEAFQPGARTDVSPAERTAMLRHVRQAIARAASSATLLLLFLLTVSSALAEETSESPQASYEAGQFSKTLNMLQEKKGTTSPLTYYNIGNCQYRLNQPGQAALSYARALLLHPGLKEAQANLAFIQRQQGAILPTPGQVDHIFTLLSPSQLWMATIICTALLALGIALLLARRRLPALRMLTALAFAASLLCALDWIYYLTRENPDFALLPTENLAYVTTATTARSSADEQGAPVIELTASSPVHLLARRGSWCYLETATGVRGWAPASAITALLPEGEHARMPRSYTISL